MSLATLMKEIADSIRAKKGTDSLIKPINFPSEIASIETGSGGGASLNIEYGLTPPTDTTKLWVQCEEPQAVEVQNYLGECAVSEVLEYCSIENPTTSTTNFTYKYSASCYIGNNQIAIFTYYNIKIFDLTSKSYVADYTLSMSGNGNASHKYIYFKNNKLYFTDYKSLYSFDLDTQTLTTLYEYAKEIVCMWIDDNIINVVYTGGSYPNYLHYRYVYNIETKVTYELSKGREDYFWGGITGNWTIFVNNTLYNFYMYTTTSTNYYTWKYNTINYTFTTFTSFYDFMTNLGWTTYYNSSLIYDNERYIYLIGGYGKYNGTNTYSDLIIKYDIVNDSFEVLEQKLLSPKYNHSNILVDNRVYMFGGSEWTSNEITYGRKNDMDYFDISYPLNSGNALITTNPNTMYNVLPLINTEALKLNSNIASAYKGNAENKAEKVNIYYYDGTTWKGINCSDYTE